MKWIGQHIWDYVSKFRNDVYLEDISTGTIASGGNLGLDSNNKIVKSANPAGTIDLTSEVTGVLPVANGGSGASSLTDNSILTGTGTSAITAETNFTYTGTALSVDAVTSTFLNATSANVYIQNTGNNAAGGILSLYNTRNGTPCNDADNVGMIRFWGNNDAGTPTATEVVRIQGEINDATSGAEEGKLEIQVASHDGELQNGLLIQSGDVDNEVDVNIGNGTASLTTIAGDLQVVGGDILGPTDGDLNITSDGSIVVNVDNDNDETNQTIKFRYDGSTDGFEFNPSRGSVAQYSTSSSEYPLIYLQNTGDNATGAGTVHFTKKRVDVSTQVGEDNDLIGKTKYTSYNDNGTPEIITFAEVRGTIADASDSDEAGKYEVKVTTSDGSTSALQNALSAVGSPSANDVDVTIGHGATSLTTIAGTLTMGSTAFVNNSGVVQVATQGTIDHDSLANFVANEHIDWTGDVSASSVIHTNNITDLHGAGVDGSDNQLLTDNGNGTVKSESTLTWDGSDLDITSATTGKPKLILNATGDNSKPPAIEFVKDRATGNGVLNDYVGRIDFRAPSSSDANLDYYSSILVQQVGVTAGSEAGLVAHKVLSDGSQTSWLTATGSASTPSVDVNVGYSTGSMCTIAGDLTLEGDLLRIAGSSSSAASITLFEDTDNGTDAVTLAAPAAVASDRTVTLPDATGTVVVDTKVLVTHSIAYYANTTSDYVIPLAGTSHSDNTNLSLYILQYFSNFAAPYNGQFKKIMFCTTSTASRDIDVKFYRNGQVSTQTGTTANYTTSGSTNGSISPTDWTFSAGDRLGIVIDPQSGNQGGHVSATIVFEFDTTT